MTNPDDAVCPLCGHHGADPDAIRVHVMCHHRKSELTDALLSLAGDEPRTRSSA